MSEMIMRGVGCKVKSTNQLSNRKDNDAIIHSFNHLLLGIFWGPLFWAHIIIIIIIVKTLSSSMS